MLSDNLGGGKKNFQGERQITEKHYFSKFKEAAAPLAHAASAPDYAYSPVFTYELVIRIYSLCPSLLDNSHYECPSKIIN
jgi:hypothetical protein